MAIPTNHIDKIKDKDSGESRPICPPADHVSVDNENYEGETLDEVLDEVAQAIEEAGQGGYAPPEGGIPKTDLAESVQDSLDKADTALQEDDVAEVAKTGSYNDLENKPTIPDTSNLATKTELQQGLGNKQDTLVAGNGIVIGNDGKTVSVDAEVVQPATADGTFAVRIGGNTYTINLNHTHPYMAKLQIVDDEPESPAMDTIYAQVDNAQEPSEIIALWVAGLEFTGGGAAPGTPRLTRPADGSTIDFGETVNGTKSMTINIKGNKYLTMPLVVALSNSSTGYAFDTSNLPTGVTYDSNTGKLTVAADAARSVDGVDIVVVYTDTASNVDGVLGITSASPDNISAEIALVVAHGLPSRYNKCNYIKNTVLNANGPYIDTGVKVSSEMKVEAKFENAVSPASSWGNLFLYGGQDWAGGSAAVEHRFSCNSSTSYVQLFQTQGSTYGTAYRTNNSSAHVFSHSKDMIVYDGVEYPASTVTEQWQGNKNLVIGALNNGQDIDSHPEFKLYYFKMYLSGVLVRDFIPAYDTQTQKYGLYDKANMQFYSSARSGKEFTGQQITQ
jgi:hypothetical protein